MPGSRFKRTLRHSAPGQAKSQFRGHRTDGRPPLCAGKQSAAKELETGLGEVQGKSRRAAHVAFYTEGVTDVSPLLSNYPIITTIPVLWGDEDAFAHVNNLAYLRWCESARVEYMRRVAFWTEIPPTGTGPIMASVKCDYKAPLTYPDTVDVGTRVTAIGNSSIRIDQVVVSRRLQAVAAAVDSTVVMLDYSAGRPVRVPDAIRAAIGALEGRKPE